VDRVKLDVVKLVALFGQKQLQHRRTDWSGGKWAGGGNE
jgi:hypothetical protein